MTGYELERPSTAFSFSRSLRVISGSRSNASSQREKDLNAQRDILERMVLERDEQISSLQKSIEVQNGHLVKLQAKVEISERREKQYHTRHKAQINNMVNERNLLKAQMEVTRDEMRRIKSDPIHLALINQDGKANKDKSSSQRWDGKAMPAGNPFSSNGEQHKEDEEQEENIKLANHAQGILLQGQLFQAMNSLSQLRQHCHVMKENYDAIVKSLQADLIDVSDERARAETELLSKIDALDQDKKLMEEALMDELRSKDARIKKLEKSLRKLDKIDDDDTDDDEDDYNEKTSSSASSAALSMCNDFPFAGNDKKKLVIETTGKSDFSTSSPVSVLSGTVDRDLPIISGEKPFKDYATVDSIQSKKSDVANMLLNAKKSQRRARELLKVTESRRRIELLKVAHNKDHGRDDDEDDALSALM